jgi:hypothetical protein
MTHLFDEFSKAMDESVPRRESLRRLAAALAGAILSPLGRGIAGGAEKNPCKAFCRCSNKTQQNQCLAACQKCNGNSSRIGGSCGWHVCCPTAACRGVCSNLNADPNCGACGNNCRAIGETCCGSYCADLDFDFNNCGACGIRCDDPAPYEYGACVEGACFYDCVEGAVDCNGACIPVLSDPFNCGACGNVCPATAPYCSQGTCGAVRCFGGQAPCDGVCREIQLDPSNCGGCGVVCGPGEFCAGGLCQPAEPF